MDSSRGRITRSRSAACLASAVILLAATPPATADVIARVAEVVDGRTVKVEVTVRLRDIEIPNQNGACAYEQALAKSVKREVQRVIGRKVALSRIEADAYGRLAARVVTRETGDLGAHLLAEGLAKETNKDPAAWCE